MPKISRAGCGRDVAAASRYKYDPDFDKRRRYATTRCLTYYKHLSKTTQLFEGNSHTSMQPDNIRLAPNSSALQARHCHTSPPSRSQTCSRAFPVSTTSKCSLSSISTFWPTSLSTENSKGIRNLRHSQVIKRIELFRYSRDGLYEYVSCG